MAQKDRVGREQGYFRRLVCSMHSFCEEKKSSADLHVFRADETPIKGRHQSAARGHSGFLQDHPSPLVTRDLRGWLPSQWPHPTPLANITEPRKGADRCSFRRSDGTTTGYEADKPGEGSSVTW
ncbi:hypothetical protein HRR83_000279 [Exophiala dermatitidis]|uniref:Uncharacterized protein n=1 Tax=Exophiala dermatitidis TaxID=5970 RepID=A0AAN6F2E2_EXODE|nr:hypothetical protein HRR73_002815 [Exophiala dermatitidis]KAJ4527527.1 hypothetical protein HRR74_000281 [Exophiala dermatitidis]KAJ4531100.1 hypothetical protein HRR76_008777 [Exophiala dermatitidis]KAJ4558266.1 hypothetical protein HRR77_000280 [Exophiala dermatitidis]KAJ4584906.1 hypothetical protein HRR81_000713 [Exophiala dermatitidis]